LVLQKLSGGGMSGNLPSGYDISVIVPVYNTEKYLHRCIKSIIAQTYSNFECILANDCSTDNSASILASYAEYDNRIKMLSNTVNMGSSLTRKAGFEASKGRYILFIDSDDWMESDMLEQLYRAANAGDYDMALCDYYIDTANACTPEKTIIDCNDITNNLGFKFCAAVWNRLIKRTIVEKVVFPQHGKYEDRVITQQALYYSKTLVKVDIPLYHYFLNEESTFRISANRYKQYFEMKANIEFLINFYHDNIPDIPQELNDNINNYVNGFKYKWLREATSFYPKSNFELSCFFLPFVVSCIFSSLHATMPQDIAKLVYGAKVYTSANNRVYQIFMHGVPEDIHFEVDQTSQGIWCGVHMEMTELSSNEAVTDLFAAIHRKLGDSFSFSRHSQTKHIKIKKQTDYASLATDLSALLRGTLSDASLRDRLLALKEGAPA
jgi:glycosyltransferase involved in cell wall biosynthesis